MFTRAFFSKLNQSIYAHSTEIWRWGLAIASVVVATSLLYVEVRSSYWAIGLVSIASFALALAIPDEEIHDDIVDTQGIPDNRLNSVSITPFGRANAANHFSDNKAA